MAKIDQTINPDDESIDTTLLLTVSDDLSFDIEKRIQWESNDNTKNDLFICEDSRIKNKENETSVSIEPSVI